MSQSRGSQPAIELEVVNTRNSKDRIDAVGCKQLDKVSSD